MSVEQTSLLDAEPRPLAEPLVRFLTGFAAQTAFGEKRTAEQERQARAAAEDCAARIARLRP